MQPEVRVKVYMVSVKKALKSLHTSANVYECSKMKEICVELGWKTGTKNGVRYPANFKSDPSGEMDKLNRKVRDDLEQGDCWAMKTIFGWEQFQSWIQRE